MSDSKADQHSEPEFHAAVSDQGDLSYRVTRKDDELDQGLSEGSDLYGLTSNTRF